MSNHDNLEEHHRRSLRLRNYDYSCAGSYFVTVCTHKSVCLFGKVDEWEMHLNNVGEMLKQWWEKISSKFPSVDLDTYVIMPNHLHGIVSLTDLERNSPVGVPPSNLLQSDAGGRPLGVAPTKVELGEIISWFKTMTTNEYIREVKNNNWRPFEGRLWQRSYYEHIIRNDSDLD